ncbi:hypothetical protein L6164_032164 [Bauhinia variegata]|uniref:Uncharacterized protein n=1 Tax=Bauhinia variegata TaxID=167791 RepID=A0ACB9KMS4_BAUVA|nr:hypothetical protein L6164_032164 [Bauhinia variegata]
MPIPEYSVICSVFLSLFSLSAFLSKAAPIYSAHYCTDSLTYKPNSTYQSNLRLLLSSLTSNANLGYSFYRNKTGSAAPDVVTGLFLCRGDILTAGCHDCVTAAAKEISHLCPNQTEAIIWYDECMVRYSNGSLNNIVPGTDLMNNKSIANSELDRFNQLLAGLLNSLATKAQNAQDTKFATGEVNLTSTETLYGLVQCTPELSLFDCTMCFRSAIASVPNCCIGKLGVRILLPGCNIRYELYLFYNSTVSLPPASPTVGSERSHRSVVLSFVIPIVVSLALFVLGFISFGGKHVRSMIESWRKGDRATLLQTH